MHPIMWHRSVLAYPGRFRKAVQNAEHLDFHAIEFLGKPAVVDESIV